MKQYGLFWYVALPESDLPEDGALLPNDNLGEQRKYAISIADNQCRTMVLALRNKSLY